MRSKQHLHSSCVDVGITSYGHLHLGCVPVSQQAVSREILIDGTERSVRPQTPPRSRHTASGIDDDAVWLYKANSDQRGRANEAAVT